MHELPQLGRDVFLNGQPQPTVLTKTTIWRADLYELLNAYCAERTKSVRKRAYRTSVRRAYPLETARKKLEQALAMLPEWRPIQAWRPRPKAAPMRRRRRAISPPPSARRWNWRARARLELRQAEAFAPLFVRARSVQNGAADEPA